jgi:hypothetical protein
MGAVLGLLLGGHLAWAENGPTLNGERHLGVSLESELSSRDMKLDGQKDRERVARHSVQLSYGLIDNLDLYAKIGLGKIMFEEADLGSQTRPLTGIGVRSTVLLSGGYFAGLSAQYQFGKVSKFERNNSTVTIEDKWTETNADLFVGTMDLVPDPEPDLRFYAGVRLSSRKDKLTPEGGLSITAKEDSGVGGMIGMDFSDRKVFRLNAELGTGDRNNICVRLGLVF